MHLLRNLMAKVSLSTLKTACHSFTDCNISYAILVWGRATPIRNVFA